MCLDQPLVTKAHRAQAIWPLAMYFSLTAENSTMMAVQNSIENPVEVTKM